jgi:hypothetical protein
MYTNYDNQGGRFGDISVQAQSSNLDVVSSYAAIEEETGNLTLILINKDPQNAITSLVDFTGFSAAETAGLYQYSADQPDDIVASSISTGSDNVEILLPPYSISLIVLSPK